MKFLRQRKDRPAPLVEQAAAAKRLRSVSDRGKEEEALYLPREEQPTTTRSKRLFWTPDDLLDAVP